MPFTPPGLETEEKPKFVPPPVKSEEKVTSSRLMPLLSGAGGQRPDFSRNLAPRMVTEGSIAQYPREPLVNWPRAEYTGTLGDISVLGNNLIAGLIGSATTPENLPKFAAGPYAPALFLGESLADAPESAKQTAETFVNPDLGFGPKLEAGVNYFLPAALGAPAFRSLDTLAGQTAARMRDARNNVNVPGISEAEIVTEPRQLQPPVTEFPGPLERGLQLPQRTPSSLVPTYEQPAGAARFATDPLGQTADLYQLSPKEQVELYRGPKEFVPREEQVRPAQQPPAIIGELSKLPSIKEIVIEPGGGIRIVPMEQGPRLEQEGGKISFASPAEGASIPSALQTQQTQPNYASPIRSSEEVLPQEGLQPEGRGEPRGENLQRVREEGTQAELSPIREEGEGPEVAQLGTSVNLNPLGTPRGTIYHASPEDWQQWQQLKSRPLLEEGVWPALEKIKNKYGGMPPVAPKSGSIPSEAKGLQTKLGLEKGQERRGETGAILPSGGEGRKPKKLSFEEESKLISFADQLNASIEQRAEAAAKIGAEWFKKAELKVGDIMYTPSGTPIKILDGYVRFPSKVTQGKTIVDYSKPMVRAEQAGPYKGNDEGVGSEGRFYLEGLTYDRPRIGLQTKLKPGQGEESGSGIPLYELASSFFSKKPGVVGGIQRLPDYRKVKAESTTPFGVGKIPLFGRLLDPRAGKIPLPKNMLDKEAWEKTLADDPLIAHQSQVNMGQNMTALWLEGRKGIARPFEPDKGGLINSKGMSDLIEAEMREPGSQQLTPKQREFVKWWTKQNEMVKKWGQEEGLKFFIDENGEKVQLGVDYFPRAPIGRKGIEKVEAETTQRVVGAEREFEHTREFPTEAMGVAKGVQYETDPYKRIARYLNDFYRAVADHRLATDPALGGKKEPASYLETQKVFHPAFRGQVFNTATAKRLNAYYQKEHSNWVKALADVNDFAKLVKFTGDVSAIFNQGLPLLGMNPYRWAKATISSFEALFNDKALKNYISVPENLKAAQQLVENGSSIARLEDFLKGGETKLGKLILPFRASARSMGTFLSVAKIELWKALKPLVEEKTEAGKKGWSDRDLAESIDNAVFSSRMEAIGVSPARALGERLLTNAPSILRSAANLSAMAAQGGAAGNVGRKALAGLATSVSLMLAAVYFNEVKMGRMTKEDAIKRFDPRNSDFLKWPLELRDGTRKEASFGNIFISIIKTLGQVIGKKQKGQDLGTGSDNPFIRFMSGRKSPAISLAYELTTGKDYRGEDVTPGQTLGRSILPASVESFGYPGSLEGKYEETKRQFFGLNVQDESFGKRRTRELNEAAMEKYPGKTYGALNLSERLKLGHEVLPKLKEGQDRPSFNVELKTQKAVRENGERVQRDLSPALQTKLDKWKLYVPGYETSIERGKSKAYMTQDEQEEFHKMQVKNTERRLTEMFGKYAFATLSQEKRQLILSKYMSGVHKETWGQVNRMLTSEKSTQ
jgi:hypothetical protein